MFDLAERLSANKNNESKLSNKLKTMLFYQTEECRSLVNESFRFDGKMIQSVLKIVTKSFVKLIY